MFAGSLVRASTPQRAAELIADGEEELDGETGQHLGDREDGYIVIDMERQNT